MKNEQHNFMRDVGIIVLSIIIAVIIARSGALEGILTSAREWQMLGSLIAGIFFVFIFTAAPAGVVLFEIAAESSIWSVALFGGFGALFGDLLIFRFIKNSLLEDVRWLVRKTVKDRLISVFKPQPFRWLTPLIGAVIVASPLPDEIGLAMMGFSKMKISTFALISFLFNFFGILMIALLAKAV